MSAFDDLLADPFAQRRYLVEIYPYDKIGLAVKAIYFCASGDGFVTEPSDSPANTVFDPSVLSPLSLEQTLFASGKLSGKSIPGAGTIIFNNADGHLDYLKDYAFDARRVVVKLGGKGFTYSQFGVIFDGTARGITWGTQELTLEVRDLQYKLDIPLQSTLYGGSGAWDGGSDLTGKPKPFFVGTVRNAEPVLVDAANLRYQVHYRQVQAITRVKDQGADLTNFGNYASLALLDAAAIPAGNYATCLVEGVFKLGSTPAGTVTFDGQGDAVGSYVSSAPDIVQRLVTAQGGLLTGDLDLTSFSAMNALTLGAITLSSVVVGYYVGSEQKTLSEVVDAISNSVGGYWGFDRSAKFYVGRLDVPSGVSADTYDSSVILDLQRQATDLPTWRFSLGYRRSWRPLTQQEIAGIFRAGGASASQGPSLTEEWRYVVASDASIKTAHLLANDTSDLSLLDSATDAAAEAARLLNIYKTQRDYYVAAVKTQPLKRKLGDVVTVAYTRYGLTTGKQFVIVGLKENAFNSTVDMELWG